MVTQPPAEGGNFTSEAPSQANEMSGLTCKATPWFGEDVKLSLRLGEVRLTPREVKPCGFVDHFLPFRKKGKKMVGVRGFEPPASASRTQRSSQTEPHPDLKASVTEVCLDNISPISSFASPFAFFFGFFRTPSWQEDVKKRLTRLAFISKSYTDSGKSSMLSPFHFDFFQALKPVRFAGRLRGSIRR